MAGRSQATKADRYRVDSRGRSIPVFDTVPTFSGTQTVGQTLTGTNGTVVSNNDTVTITRQWFRNDVPIPGANAATYVLAAADQGKRVRFGNVATNAVGRAFSVSTVSGVIP